MSFTSFNVFYFFVNNIQIFWWENLTFYWARSLWKVFSNFIFVEILSQFKFLCCFDTFLNIFILYFEMRVRKRASTTRLTSFDIRFRLSFDSCIFASSIELISNCVVFSINTRCWEKLRAILLINSSLKRFFSIAFCVDNSKIHVWNSIWLYWKL